MTYAQRIDALIPENGLLKPGKVGFHGSLSGNFNWPDDFFVKDSAFDEIHVNLARALRLAAIEDIVINRASAKNLLRLWHCGAFIKSINGESFAIYEAYGLDVEDGSLIIKGDGLKYEDVNIPGMSVSIKLPSRSGATNITVDPDWFNNFYPGWQSRVSITTSIGMEPMEALRSVLSEQVIVTPSAPPEDLAF